LNPSIKKWANQASKQAINQHFDSMTTTAQRAAVVKIPLTSTRKVPELLVRAYNIQENNNKLWLKLCQAHVKVQLFLPF